MNFPDRIMATKKVSKKTVKKTAAKKTVKKAVKKTAPKKSVKKSTKKAKPLSKSEAAKKGWVTRRKNAKK